MRKCSKNKLKIMLDRKSNYNTLLLIVSNLIPLLLLKCYQAISFRQSIILLIFAAFFFARGFLARKNYNIQIDALAISIAYLYSFSLSNSVELSTIFFFLKNERFFLPATNLILFFLAIIWIVDLLRGDSSPLIHIQLVKVFVFTAIFIAIISVFSYLFLRRNYMIDVGLLINTVKQVIQYTLLFILSVSSLKTERQIIIIDRFLTVLFSFVFILSRVF